MTSGWRYRRLDGAKDPNTGLFIPGPPPTPVDDGFRLALTQPTDSNVGTGDPAILRVHEGDLIKTDTTPVQNLDIRGQLVLRAPALVQNCIGRGPLSGRGAAIVAEASAAGYRIERTSVIPQTPSLFQDGFRLESRGVTYRTRVQDCIDGFRVLADDVEILAPLVERFVYIVPVPNRYQDTDRQPHTDAVQIEKGRRVRIIGGTWRGFYGPAGTHQPNNYGGPTPSGWPNPSFAWVLLSANVGPISDLEVTDNWVYGFDLPMNVGSGSVAGVHLGDWLANKFDGTSRPASSGLPWTISKRSDQTANFGFGTPRSNALMDGRLITTARSA